MHVGVVVAMIACEHGNLRTDGVECGMDEGRGRKWQIVSLKHLLHELLCVCHTAQAGGCENGFRLRRCAGEADACPHLHNAAHPAALGSVRNSLLVIGFGKSVTFSFAKEGCSAFLYVYRFHDSSHLQNSRELSLPPNPKALEST